MARYRAAVIAADTATIAFAIWLACEIRGQWGIWGDGEGESGLAHLCVEFGPWIAIAWVGWLALRGSYSSKYFGAGGEEFTRVFVASLLTAGTVAMVCYLTKYDLSRGFVCLSFLLGTPLLLAERLAARKALEALRRRGALLHRVVVVGDSAASAHIAEILHRESHVGYSVVGACTPDAAPTGIAGELDVPVLGSPDQVRQVATAVNADSVLVAGGQLGVDGDVRRLAWSLEGTDIDLIVVPSITDIAGPRVHVRPVAGLPLLHVEPPQADEAVRWGKRAFDVAGSAVLLILLAPVLAAVATAVKLGDRGPVLFRQRRVGLNGADFVCLKFRSMSLGAEELLETLGSLNESDGVLFKIRDDPRVTSIGRLIRRYSLDELPQLVNVLRGQMSLVGPRPPLPSEVAAYEETAGRRLLVRPGLTGLWQVSGRSDLSWRDSVRLDLYYVDNWSLFQDIVILLKTIRAVLGTRGAS